MTTKNLTIDGAQSNARPLEGDRLRVYGIFQGIDDVGSYFGDAPAIAAEKVLNINDFNDLVEMYLDDVNVQNTNSDKFINKNAPDCIYGYLDDYGAGYYTISIAKSAYEGAFGIFNICGIEFRSVVHPVGDMGALSAKILTTVHGYFQSFDKDITGYYAPTFVVTGVN